MIIGLALVISAPVGAGRAQQAPAPADAPEAADRPRVGLVLSGGSAKGIAHIGAIRVLEEAGLPVDVVTGTSMGSIVGGLYAIGYTPDMMIRIMREQDWRALLTDDIPRDRLDAEARINGGETLLSVPVRDGSITLPSGVVEGQRVLDLLTRLTWPYHAVEDFTRLPRPFAALTMDLRTGEDVRFTSGSLPLVIRASMSLPTLFAPVTLDGRTLVDGGLVRNLPAEDARALGADVLVCVDVGTAMPKREGFSAGSLVDVLVRAASIRGELALPEQRERCDVLIEPDTDGLADSSFDEADAWVGRGEEAARDKLPQVRALVERLGRPAVREIPPPEIEPVEIVAVEVRGGSEAAERLVRRRLALDIPARLTPEEAGRKIERVYASGVFDWVSYQVLPADSASTTPDAGRTAGQRLVVEVEERRGDALGFGFRYDNQDKAALLFSLSLRNRLVYGSTTRLTARLGQQMQFSADFFSRPRAGSLIGTGARASYTSVPVDFFGGNGHALVRGRLNVYDGSIRVSHAVSRAAFLSIGVEGEHVRAEPKVGADTLGNAPVETMTQTFYTPALLLEADTRDRTSLPTRGVRAYLGGRVTDRAIGSGATFQHYVADAEVFVPITPALTALGRVALTHGRGSDLPPNYMTFIGGLYPTTLLPGRFFPLFGAEAQELIGRSGQLARVGIRWIGRKDVFAEVVANAGAAGEKWTLDPDALRFGGGVTAGLLTFAGPISVTLAGNRLDRWPSIGFNLGYVF